jgi:hypothetical protein
MKVDENGSRGIEEERNSDEMLTRRDGRRIRKD